ncbi:VacJ family lipoprotein [Solidesulfovibrio fructosivorans JJ]]|uniref:VacJ family lipoprotein n=1 Tax=Solidesulfovibrio fructosivorans JJ] TaxID=596151 RepID=E1JU44_SOLFR|nr:VacJ family lipoprotein [Solidesulfovibrio fructosivorans]EFL51974.1 VacJ family lipoprotein [Solidesulfovibrio fructosivorans JJ]]
MNVMPRRLIIFPLLAAMLLAGFDCYAAPQTGAADKDATPAVSKVAKPFIPSATAESAAQPSVAAPKATTPADDEYDAAPAPVADPLYRWNKFWFGFNNLFYSGLMRPFAKGYAYVVPKPLRQGLTNAYQNFIFPIRFLNALLQLDFTKASREFGRFMINSTLGIGGLMDVAKADPNLQPGNEDFGQTLGHYGMGDGFYIVWPLLGPSSVRDSIGLVGDAAANPLTWIFGPWAIHDDYNPWYWSYIIKAGDVFNNLPGTLEAYDSVVGPAVDPYSAMKDAYIQYRRNAVSK